MTIKKAYDYAKAYLKNIPDTEPVFEAKQIIMHITGYSAAYVLENYQNNLPPDKFDTLCSFLSRRKQAEPLQYILGNWDFFGLNFKVGKGVLIPRSDTEILAQTAIDYIKDKPLTVFDLCSGSGCIAAAVAKNCKNAKVYAIEKDPTAINYLNYNIKALNVDVRVITDDIFTYTPTLPIDVIISNPPYIPTADIKGLSKSVQFEPMCALDGGEDGLLFYRQIATRWQSFLNKNGKIFVEIGFNQAHQVNRLFSAANLTNIKIINDYSGLNRVVSAQKE